MVAAADVTLIAGKKVVHIPVNGDKLTVAGLLQEAGISGEATVRIDAVLVTDHATELKGGETVTAFATKTVAEAGVKGAHKSS